MSDPIQQAQDAITQALEAAKNYAKNQVSDVWNAASDLVDRNINSNNPNLDQSRYDFTYRSFPKDLGAEYNNHYMVININVPVNSEEKARGAYYGTSFEDRDFRSTILNNEYSKVDNLRFNPNSLNPGSTTVGGPLGTGTSIDRELYTFKRGTRRIKESIALYIPAPMIYTQQNIYEDVSLTSVFGQAGKLGVGVVADTLSSIATAALTKSIQSARRGQDAVGRLIDTGGTVLGTAFNLAGTPINPRIEVLFSTTPQRQFVFEFLLAPRSAEESKTMKNIIQSLRFHAAPEISSALAIGGIGIPTFIPPSDFDITFYQGGKENLSIPRINTCVLERCEVDYAPSGVWSTFSNGHPVAARLSLAFREVEIVHKRRVVQGF